MKSFFSVLTLFLSFYILISSVHATTPVPTQPPILTQAPVVGNLPMPGQNCGTVNNKCCFSPIKNITNLPNPIGIIPGPIMSMINDAMEKVIKPITDPLSQMAQNIMQPCIDGTPSTPGDSGNANCVCVKATLPSLSSLSSLCKGVSAGEQGECNKCLNDGGVWTAATCVYASVQSFIEKTLLGWGIGLAGIVSLLCIIYAAFMIQTSQGSPEKIKKAQELLTSCIMGLMLIIFSIFILKLIGVDILRIPEFK